MKQRPILETDRLLLRPFEPGDAKVVQTLAGDWSIADTTASIPHPYPDGAAEKWIGSHQAMFEAGTLLNFAIVLRETNELMGCISIMDISKEHEHGEMGYWMGKPYWNHGYCTEAASAMVDYAFSQRGLHRIQGQHFRRNPASGQVMRKIGMIEEGCLRDGIKRYGKFEDVVVYGILKSEWGKKIALGLYC